MSVTFCDSTSKKKFRAGDLVSWPSFTPTPDFLYRVKRYTTIEGEVVIEIPHLLAASITVPEAWLVLRRKTDPVPGQQVKWHLQAWTIVSVETETAELIRPYKGANYSATVTAFAPISELE